MVMQGPAKPRIPVQFRASPPFGSPVGEPFVFPPLFFCVSGTSHLPKPGNVKPVADEYHPPVEEYLTTIYELAEDGVTVIQARLVERLGHSAPSVFEMMKRLAAKGYITQDGRTISLTIEGRALAEGVVRKHRLAERLLTDIIGLPWDKAHSEAGRWEHVISDEVEERLRIILDDPNTCPHGNPIPGTKPVTTKLFRLSEVPSGSLIRLERVTETVEIDDAAMAYLSDNQFITGSEALVSTRAPDGSVSLQVGMKSVAVGAHLGANLYVALTEDLVPA
jgi:DtxR family transcriptional regulator, Mn-dependent transcriptional regulator